MNKSNKLEQQWQENLQSSNRETVATTLLEIKNAGHTGMLPHVLEELRVASENSVKKLILQYISEIKSPEAIPHIIKCLQSKDYDNVHNQLVAACWQSGLDFSGHLPVFARLFAVSDYFTAVEAFTVIEESLTNATDEQRIECIQSLNRYKDSISEDKTPLYLELIKIVRD